MSTSKTIPVKLDKLDLSKYVIILTGATDGKYFFQYLKLFLMILILFFFLLFKASVKKWQEF
jgi:hypothetical protein